MKSSCGRIYASTRCYDSSIFTRANTTRSFGHWSTCASFPGPRATTRGSLRAAGRRVERMTERRQRPPPRSRLHECVQYIASAALDPQLRLVFSFFAVLCAIPSARANEVPLVAPGPVGVSAHRRVRRNLPPPNASTRAKTCGASTRRWRGWAAKSPPVVRNGTTYTYGADCALKLPSGVMTFSTTTVLTADSDSAYRLENRMTNQGTTTDESITGRRVADCAR